MTVTGFTTGLFDVLQIGHVRHLDRARQYCDRLIVGVLTDELSASPPLRSEDRAAIVGSLECVDTVFPQQTIDRWQVWQELQFDVLAVGDEWKDNAAWAEYRRLGEAGVQVVYLPYTGQMPRSAAPSWQFGRVSAGSTAALSAPPTGPSGHLRWTAS